MSFGARCLAPAGLVLSAFALARPVSATPGTHAPSVSSYDTRASSIVFGYRRGLSDAGNFNTFSYNANFTSTTGRLSAQFGIHYVNFAPAETDTKAHGLAGSGVAVLVYPAAGRYENGVPKAAFALHLGAVPTAFISGERNFLTFPFVLGFGVPLSPARAVTFTPWYELAVSANLDTVVAPDDVTLDVRSVTVDPKTGTATLDSAAVKEALSKGVKIELGVSVPMRAGLEAALHLGKRVDLNVYGMLSTLGGGFSGALVTTLGGALVIRWDEIVSAVLPPSEATPPESCELAERRFRSCPNARFWLSPEQRGQAPSVEAAPSALPAAPVPQAAPRVPPPPSPVPLEPSLAPQGPNFGNDNETPLSNGAFPEP